MTEFQKKLVQKMNEFVHLVYKTTKKFPRDELFGSVSQFRRAALSVVLNYIEGFARRKPAVQLNFFEISYGSLKEAKYLLSFSHEEGYLTNEVLQQGLKLSEEIGAMLWSEIVSVEKNIEKNKVSH